MFPCLMSGNRRKQWNGSLVFYYTVPKLEQEREIPDSSGYGSPESNITMLDFSSQWMKWRINGYECVTSLCLYSIQEIFLLCYSNKQLIRSVLYSKEKNRKMRAFLMGLQKYPSFWDWLVRYSWIYLIFQNSFAYL